MVDVLAFDIDGTLTESRQVIPKDVAKRLVELGRRYKLIFITSGDLHLVQKQVLHPLSERLLINNSLEELVVEVFATTGSAHYTITINSRRYDIKMNYEKKICSWDKVRIFHIIYEMVKYDKTYPITSFNDIVQDRKTQINFSLVGRSAPLKQKMLYDPDGKLRIALVNKFNSMLPENIIMYVGGTTSIDFLQKNINKGSALATWMREKDYVFEDVIFFGDRFDDNGNDRSILGVCITKEVDAVNNILSLLNSNDKFK